MTDERFRYIAGVSSNFDAYLTTWLTKVVIDQLDEESLLKLIDKAIDQGEATLTRIKNTFGAEITPYGKRTGNPVSPEVIDEMFGSFRQNEFLKSVRDRLLPEKNN